MRLRAVVVNYNGGNFVLRATASLLEDPAGVDEIVVVDNDSSDGSDKQIEHRFPDVRLIRAGGNLGFGRGANLGIGNLRGVDGIVLLNPDAEGTNGWLGPLVDALDGDDRVGAALPKIRFAGSGPPVINNAGSVVDWSWNAHDRGIGDPDDGRWDQPAEVPAWCGAAVLLGTNYLRDSGLFDERFFLYYEDVELSVRGARRGWRYLYTPTSVVYHLHARTTGVGSPLFEYENVKSRLLLADTWGTTATRALAWTRFAGGVLRRGGGELVRGRVRLPGARRRVTAAREATRLARLGPQVPYPAGVT